MANLNPLVAGLFSEFRKERELEAVSEDDAFELFSAHLVLGRDLIDAAPHITDFLLDPGAIGIDVIAIEINGHPVFDESDVHDIAGDSAWLEVAVTFIQAKRSTSLSSVDVLGFGDAVKRFLQSENSDNFPKLQVRSNALKLLFSKYAGKLKRSPSAALYFVTTAPDAAISDKNVGLRIDAVREDIERLGFVDRPRVECVGATRIHQLWKIQAYANEVELKFHKQLNLPEMSGIDQAILGIVSVSEVVKLMKDQDGAINEKVFYDNVRGFQGKENPVNAAIMESMRSDDRGLIPVLNNGITVVARSYSPKPGDTVALSDYQIVNGCQTSHSIFYAYDELGDKAGSVFVPLRLVVTSDEEVANRIIRATNSQTPVEEKDLVALTRFQKQLEDFYRTDTYKVELTYERRPGQFFEKNVIKTRVVTIFDQIRAVSALFLDDPHTAGRYAGSLYKDIGDRIFRDDHKLAPYIASSFAAYRLENAFRTSLSTKYKPARYHILMAFKYLVLGGSSGALNSSRVEADSLKIINSLKDARHLEKFQLAAKCVEEAGKGAVPTSDRLKRGGFTDDLRKLLLDSKVVNA